MTSDRGAVSSEFAVVMTVFLASFMLLVVFAGRSTQAENDVRSAAHEAARAGSLANTPDTARSAATQTALANLAETGLSCAHGSRVDVATSNFEPGGTITVTVSCTASFGDLAALAVPGSRTFSSSATEVIDTYRASP